MNKFDFVKEERPLDWPKAIQFNPALGGYVSATSSRLVTIVKADMEEYFRFLAGERKHLFPNFDQTKHYARAATYQAEVAGYKDIPITLHEVEKIQTNEIPYGCFYILTSDTGPYLKQFHFSTDGYIDLGRKEYANIYQDFCNFRNKRDVYAKAKKRHRSSSLIFGSPGNGKTREICRILQDAEKNKFRAIFISSHLKTFMDLENFRKALEGEDLIFVIEEITERTTQKTDVDELLSFLDGELSWNHSYTIATTNYPEELPWNIVDRPGRFKNIIEIPVPNVKERIAYLKGSNVPDDEIAEAAQLTEGLSIDYLGSIVFDHMVTKKPITELLDELKRSREKIGHRFKRTIGLSETTAVPTTAPKQFAFN